MSKAFTRESDDAPAPPAPRRGVPVPEPNYMTPAGARAARAELAACLDERSEERGGGDPAGSAGGAGGGASRGIDERSEERGGGASRGIDESRIRELTEHLTTAQIIEPPADRSVAGLGATVTLEDATGKRMRYRIVGALEADARRGLVFWQSPLAGALYGTRVGDTVTLPRGAEAEVIAIDYE